MRGQSVYKLTDGVAGGSARWRSAETPVGGRRRMSVVGALVVLAGVVLAGVFGGVAVAHPSVDRAGDAAMIARSLSGHHRQAPSRHSGEGALPADLPEAAQNETVPCQRAAVGPETAVGAVPGTVDEGLPDGSSWT